MRKAHHPKIDEVTLASVLHALSDPVRLTITRRLAAGKQSSRLGDDLPIAKSTMSHHLRVLREAGLIHIDIEDGRQFVTLRRKELDEHLPGLLGTILGLADTEDG